MTTEAQLWSEIEGRLGTNGFVIATPVRQSGQEYSGTLTTRTDDDTGAVTAVTSNHEIGTGDLVSLVWSGGTRSSMSVSSVSGAVIGVDGGSGDSLPAQGTSVDVYRRARLMETNQNLAADTERRRYYVVCAAEGKDTEDSQPTAEDPSFQFFVEDKGGAGEKAYFHAQAFKNPVDQAPGTTTDYANLARLFSNNKLRQRMLGALLDALMDVYWESSPNGGNFGRAMLRRELSKDPESALNQIMAYASKDSTIQANGHSCTDAQLKNVITTWWNEMTLSYGWQPTTPQTTHVLGELTTRTDANTGTITAITSTHGVAVNDVLGIEWSGGHRKDMIVTAVSGADVTIDGGSGGDLPTQGTSVYIVPVE